MNIICAYCGKDMGTKPVEEEPEGCSHGICEECFDMEIKKLDAI